MKLLNFSCGDLILAVLASFVTDIIAAPAGTAFTYQGHLNNAGQPAKGNYDLKFTLYDAATGVWYVATTTNSFSYSRGTMSPG
ncbi:MAG: hypothetical protein NT154_23585, partial [Verrucomicrobia bacterium]|nr:hypothetical protein [Verrucomicrobiota bacterium]